MKKEAMTGKEVRKQIKDSVNGEMNTLKKQSRKTGRAVKGEVSKGVDTLKKESSKVMGNVKKAASAANRKGKAAVRAIKS
jgi:gas vesicle protein